MENMITMDIEILKKEDIDHNIQKQVRELFNQLNSNLKQRSLEEVLEASNNLVFAIYKEEEQILGMATMATYKAISGHKGMIEDVVVDGGQRGKGLGRKLMEKLLEEGKKMELDEILLFSGHHRTAAIKLYTSLGFQLKNSGLYRLIMD